MRQIVIMYFLLRWSWARVLGGLDEGVGSFEQAGGEGLRCPGEDPVSVLFDYGDEVLDGLCGFGCGVGCLS
jgi:hypothetical protein